MTWGILASVMGVVIVLLCWAIVRVGHGMCHPRMEADSPDRSLWLCNHCQRSQLYFSGDAPLPKGWKQVPSGTYCDLCLSGPNYEYL